MTGIRTHTLLLTTPELGSGELVHSATTRQAIKNLNTSTSSPDKYTCLKYCKSQGNNI